MFKIMKYLDLELFDSSEFGQVKLPVTPTVFKHLYGLGSTNPKHWPEILCHRKVSEDSPGL